MISDTENNAGSMETKRKWTMQLCSREYSFYLFARPIVDTALSLTDPLWCIFSGEEARNLVLMGESGNMDTETSEK
jgi:hypothetical protein